MTKPKLFGYSDKLSVKPGDLLQFYVNGEGTDRAEAKLVRLIHGDQHPSGPGFMEEEIDCHANGTWQVERQYTQLGSFLQVADSSSRLALEGSLTVFAFICPTRPQLECRQTLIGRWDNREGCGFYLGISQNGRLEFTVGQGAEVDRLEADVPMQANTWYFVAAAFEAKTGRASLFQEGVLNRYNSL
ncbi:LamG-like jellyroll fold domain-containing protein [Bradyrhizobium sp. ma5]